jgi:hypothetical protein
MMFLVGVALGWLGIASLVAFAFLKNHLRIGTGLQEKLDWQLIAAIAIVWPWPLWVCYSSHNTPIPRTVRVGLVAIVLVGALGSGWVGGLHLYDSLNPKDLEPADKVAISSMIEKIIDPKWTGSAIDKIERLDERRLEWIALHR